MASTFSLGAVTVHDAHRTNNHRSIESPLPESDSWRRLRFDQAHASFRTCFNLSNGFMLRRTISEPSLAFAKVYRSSCGFYKGDPRSTCTKRQSSWNPPGRQYWHRSEEFLCTTCPTIKPPTSVYHWIELLQLLQSVIRQVCCFKRYVGDTLTVERSISRLLRLMGYIDSASTEPVDLFCRRHHINELLNDVVNQSISVIPRSLTSAHIQEQILRTCLELLTTRDPIWMRSRPLLFRLSLRLCDPLQTLQRTRWIELLLPMLHGNNQEPDTYKQLVHDLLTADLERAVSAVTTPHDQQLQFHLPYLIQALIADYNSDSVVETSCCSLIELFRTHLAAATNIAIPAPLVPHVRQAIHSLWPISLQHLERMSSLDFVKSVPLEIVIAMLCALPSSELNASLSPPFSALVDNVVSEPSEQPLLCLCKFLDLLLCYNVPSTVYCLTSECIFRTVLLHLCTRNIWPESQVPSPSWYRSLIRLWINCVRLLPPGSFAIPLVSKTIDGIYKDIESHMTTAHLFDLCQFAMSGLFNLLCTRNNHSNACLDWFVNLAFGQLMRIEPGSSLDGTNNLVDVTSCSLVTSFDGSVRSPCFHQDSERVIPSATTTTIWAMLAVLVLRSRSGSLLGVSASRLSACLRMSRPYLSGTQTSLIDLAWTHVRNAVDLFYQSNSDSPDWIARFCALVRNPLIILFESNSEKSKNLSSLLLNLCTGILEVDGSCALWQSLLRCLSEPLNLNGMGQSDQDRPFGVTPDEEAAHFTDKLISPSLVLELLRVCLRLAPVNRIVAPTPPLNGIIITSWLECHDTLSTQLSTALCSNSRRTYDEHYTIQRQTLVDEVLDIIPSCDPSIIAALLKLLSLLILGVQCSPNQFSRPPYSTVRLSPTHLSKMVRLVVNNLKGPEGSNQSLADYLLASSLLQLLIDWTELLPSVLVPSVYTSWPLNDPLTSDGFAVDQQHDLRTRLSPHRWSWAKASLSVCGTPSATNEPTDGNRSGSDSLRPSSVISAGLLLSTWIQLPASDRDIQPYVDCPPSFDEVGIGEHTAHCSLLHWFTLEGSGQPPWFTQPSHFYPASSIPTDTWSLQVWISVCHAALLIRVHHRCANGICRSSGSSDFAIKTAAVFDGVGWIPIEPRPFSEESWRHVFLQFNWLCPTKIKVSVVWDACWSSETVIQLSDACSPEPKSIEQGPDSDSHYLWLLMGHRSVETEAFSDRYSKVTTDDYRYSLGTILFFKADEDDVISIDDDGKDAIKQLALKFLLLGPDWYGYLDSLECGARYRSTASCVLHALVRQLACVTDSAQAITELLLHGTSVIQSPSWLDTIRRRVHSSLWAVFPSQHPKHLLYRFRGTVGSPFPKIGSGSAASTTFANQNHLRSLEWLFDPHAAAPFVTQTSYCDPVHAESELRNTRLSTNVTIVPVRRISAEELFEPHGGIDVAVYLLGQIVCHNPGGTPSVGSLAQLQAQALGLLFSLLRQSTVLASQFNTPALPDPGVEASVRSRRKLRKYVRGTWTMPLSRGHCLLARLIKHPNFAAGSSRTCEVIAEHLFCSVPYWFKGQTETIQLLLDPGLLRCLLAFGPRTMWLPACSVRSPVTRHGLLPYAFQMLSHVVQLRSDQRWSAVSALTVMLIDRWQLLPVALTAFREHFVEHFIPPSEPQGETTGRLSWPIFSLLKLCSARLVHPGPSHPAGHSLHTNYTRMLFNRLIRTVISLDADLYLTATERVFAGRHDGDAATAASMTEVVSTRAVEREDPPHPLWFWWHHMVTGAMAPELWKEWTVQNSVTRSDTDQAAETPGNASPAKLDSTEAGVPEINSYSPSKSTHDQPLTTTTATRIKQAEHECAFQNAKCPNASNRDATHPVVDWTRLPPDQVTPAELEVMARFTADVAKRVDAATDSGFIRCSAQVPLPSQSEFEDEESAVERKQPAEDEQEDEGRGPSSNNYKQNNRGDGISTSSIVLNEDIRALQIQTKEAQTVSDAPCLTSENADSGSDHAGESLTGHVRLSTLHDPTYDLRSQGTRQQDLAFSLVHCLDEVWSSLAVTDAPQNSPLPSKQEPARRSVLERSLSSMCSSRSYECRHLGDSECYVPDDKPQHQQERIDTADATPVLLSSDQTRQFTSVLKPPLWWVNSLMAHPCVRMREVAINAYHIWLLHTLSAPSTNPLHCLLTQTADAPRPHLVWNQMARQLLQYSQCLHLSDPQSAAQFNMVHRHMCSPVLLNRAFDLVRRGAAIGWCTGTSTLSSPPPMDYPNELSSERVCPTQTFATATSRSSVHSSFSSGSEASLDANETQSTTVHATIEHLPCAWPVLFAALLTSAMDAVRSSCCHWSLIGITGPLPDGTTPEVELCIVGLTTLTKMLEQSDLCYFSTAMQAGLLPLLYSLVWILEASILRCEERLPAVQGRVSSGQSIDSLIPLVTSLSRLVARVAQILLQNPSSCDVQFDTLTKFIRHLIVLSPTQSTSTMNLNEQAPFNPGPVTRCIVRRMLYTIVDTLTQKLDAACCTLRRNAEAKQNKKLDAQLVTEVERLFKQLTWAVNFTVDVLTYSEPEDTLALRSFKTFESANGNPMLMSDSQFLFTWLFGARRELIAASADARSRSPPRSSSVTAPLRRAPSSQQRQQKQRVSGISRSRSASRDTMTRVNGGGDVGHQPGRPLTWSGCDYTENPFSCFQRSLDQALITSLFTTASHIQNGSLFRFPTAMRSITSSDCLTVFCRALSRLLVAKTQPPVVDVALDPFVAYLLKLSNEEPGLLKACLTSLPQLFSFVFWSNLIDLEHWLLALMASELVLPNVGASTMSNSTMALLAPLSSETSGPTRSSSLSQLSGNSPTDFVVRQLEQLFHTVRSLLSTGLNPLPTEVCVPRKRRFNGPARTRPITGSEVFRHRDLLMLAQNSAKERWLASLPSPPTGYATRGHGVSMPTSKPPLPTLVDLLLPSFSASSAPRLFTASSSTLGPTVPTTRNSPSPDKRYSPKHLAALAHHQCLDGHNAWLMGASERRRICGPLGSILWARVADRLAHDCALFYDSASAPGLRCVDPVEGPMRQRRRMFTTHFPLADRLVVPERQAFLAHRRAAHPIAALISLPDRIDHPPDRRACVWSHLPLYLPLPATPLVQLASASRHNMQGVWACSLVGLVHIPPVEGDLILGQSWLRFQPDQSTNRTDVPDTIWHVNPTDRLWLAWPLTSIDRVEERRYALRDLAVEIFPDRAGGNTPTLFAMRSTKDRNTFIETLHRQLTQHSGSLSPKQQQQQQQRVPSRRIPTSGEQHRQHRHSVCQHQCLRRLQFAQRSWLSGRMSNFAYLMELNCAAGRTYNDLMQYPIFPWIIKDYHSSVLDLGHPASYRRLDRPIAVQLPERAEAVAAYYTEAERFAQSLLDELTDPADRVSNRTAATGGIGGGPEMAISPKLAGVVCPPYHYPSHCSNEAIVLNFLVRLPPYTFRHLRFQDNNFDVPDRLFHSVATTWDLTTTTVTCVKELVPEFYFTSELFINSAGLSLGQRQPGDPVDSVVLPPWAKGNPRLFTLVNRAALESDYTTNLLPAWIDLIFGYKQTGSRAKEALNLYHPYTYFGAIDVDVIGDPIRAQAVEAMISNYGQTPKQLFKRRPHPNRFTPSGFTPEHQLSLHTRAELPNQEDWIAIDACDLPILTIENPPGTEDHTDPTADTLDQLVLEHCSRPTLSTHSDITPLETVIGLRWGTWAGSPHAPPLQLLWTCQLERNSNDAATHVGYLCTALWYPHEDGSNNAATLDLNPTQAILTAKALEDLWDGCVLCPDNRTQPLNHRNMSRRATRSKSLHLSLTHWQWTVLGCEANSRVWLIAGSTGPLLVKVTCTDHHTYGTPALLVHTRPLQHSIAMEKLVMTLMLPTSPIGVDTESAAASQLPFVTALTVSNTTRCHWNQLFIGTRTGSVYVRRLPTSVNEVSENGWLPEEYGNNYAFRRQDSNRSSAQPVSVQPGEPPFRWDFPDTLEAGLWELTAWRQLVGHADCAIRALAVCPPYGLLASGDAQGRVCLWDVHRLTLICRLQTGTATDYNRDPVGGYLGVSTAEPDESSGSLAESVDESSEAFEPQESKDFYPSADGLCFNHISGELAVARWDRRTYKACWIGVYSPSGSRVAVRILDFFAEISDASSMDGESASRCTPADPNAPVPPVPMAYSTCPEGRGVNCLVLGGPGGRLVWLNSWTLDTVHTMLLPQTDGIGSPVTALCFTPSAQAFGHITHQPGEVLCQGLCVADGTGRLFYLSPSPPAGKSKHHTGDFAPSYLMRQLSNVPVRMSAESYPETISWGVWLQSNNSPS